MKILWSNLKQSLPVIAMVTLALSAAAQEGEGGQNIIFSSPQPSDSQAVTPSLRPQNSQLLTLPGTSQAPMSSLPDDLQDASLPPPMNFSDLGRFNQQRNERQNWLLMTPKEIFGVTTTEEMLKPPERDAFGRIKTPSQLERFLDRESQARIGATNDWRGDRTSLPWTISRNADDDNPFARWRSGMSDSARNWNGFIGSRPGQNSTARQDVNIDGNVYDPILQQKLKNQKLEQMAAMDRFRQMMQPSPAPTPAADSWFTQAPKPVVDPNMSQPDYVPNPAGASFKPLISNIGRPVGLTPLPGIVTPYVPPPVPSWKPKPPPWISGAPTAFPQQQY